MKRSNSNELINLYIFLMCQDTYTTGQIINLRHCDTFLYFNYFLFAPSSVTRTTTTTTKSLNIFGENKDGDSDAICGMGRIMDQLAIGLGLKFSTSYS